MPPTNLDHYYELRSLIEAFPPASDTAQFQADMARWAGKASALFEEIERGLSGDRTDRIMFNVNAQGPINNLSYHAMFSLACRFLARLERAIPHGTVGGFIPSGGEFSAVQAVSGVVSTAQKYVLFVDPYASSTLLTDFAALVPEAISIRVLADAADVKADFAPSLARWKSQYSTVKPIQAKLSPRKSLHDRSIIVDGKKVYSVSQSFNAIARRSPAVISEFADPEISNDKMSYYLSLWDSAIDL